MHSVRRLRLLLPTTATLVAIAAALAMPTSAHAILVGMESNRELVNSTQTPELQAEALQKMKDQGVAVVRANYRWYEVAEGCAGQSPRQLENHLNPCYTWDRLDSLVQQANQRRMSVLLSLTQNPSWLHRTDNRLMMGTGGAFNRGLVHYAAFHKAAGTRYRQGSGFGFVRFWTIHNEPNSRTYWGGMRHAASPRDYARLYAAAAVALKGANPAALIAPGPTGPTGGAGGIRPVRFVREFQTHVVRYLPGPMANKKRFINAWAHNPYPGFNHQPHKAAGASHVEAVSMAMIDRLFKQLDKAPITRGTKVWATEFGWETNGPFSTNERLQAQFIAEAFDWLNSKRRVQIGISYGLTDPPAADVHDWTSGTFTNAGKPKQSYAMFQRMVSVPQAGTNGVVRAGTKLRIWGRSNVNPGGTLLSYRLVGRKCNPGFTAAQHCLVPGQRGVPGMPGAKVGYLTAVRGQRIQVRTYDRVANVYGPIRTIIVR